MAKYLDSNGLSHLMTLIKSAISGASSALINRTHRHSVGATTGAAASVTAGTAASLSTNTVSVPNVTSVGSAPTLGTAFSIPNISKKTVVTSHTAMSATVASNSNTLVITKDSSSSGDSVTEGTAFSVPNVTSVGSAPTLGTAISVKEVDTFTANTPTAVTPNTVVTAVDSYTGYSGI